MFYLIPALNNAPDLGQGHKKGFYVENGVTPKRSCTVSAFKQFEGYQTIFRFFVSVATVTRRKYQKKVAITLKY